MARRALINAEKAETCETTHKRSGPFSAEHPRARSESAHRIYQLSCMLKLEAATVYAVRFLGFRRVFVERYGRFIYTLSRLPLPGEHPYHPY
jgi:hypothetical protein